jgi:hypothetical protein
VLRFRFRPKAGCAENNAVGEVSEQIPGSDHMVFCGAALPITMGHIDDWIARNHAVATA